MAGSTLRARFGALGVAFAAALALAAMLAPTAQAGTGAQCPRVKNKPDQIPHVNYQGVQHLTYCVGPVTIKPGQNVIRLYGTNLFPKVPGYITRFDPELVYPNGKVPRVDIIHLHHAVWLVNGNPQFAVGEEKTIVQLPQGFGWRSQPSDSWGINDMLHNLTARAARSTSSGGIDFVPDSSPAAATMKTAHTRWMDVSGPSPGVGISSPIYPVFDALKGWGTNGKYTFPDQAPAQQTQLVGPSQGWTTDHPVTLLGTAGHLHPGGLYTDLDVTRGGRRSGSSARSAKYFEPAGAVSWDVAMKATPTDWRVTLKPGDILSVHATYDTARAAGTRRWGSCPSRSTTGPTPGASTRSSSSVDQNGLLTHGHLRENRHHGGRPAGLPNPLGLPDGPLSATTRSTSRTSCTRRATCTPRARPAAAADGPRRASRLTFNNLDAAQTSAYHTITACSAPCNRDTGIAYPLANGHDQFDSGELGHNSRRCGAPAGGHATPGRRRRT